MKFLQKVKNLIADAQKGALQRAKRFDVSELEPVEIVLDGFTSMVPLVNLSQSGIAIPKYSLAGWPNVGHFCNAVLHSRGFTCRIQMKTTSVREKVVAFEVVEGNQEYETFLQSLKKE